MRKRLLMIAMVLLLLTPTVLALLNVYQVKNETAASFTVVLYDHNEQPIASDSGNPDEASPKSLLGIFYQIASSGEPLTQIPGDPQNDPYVLAKCTLNGTESQWRCYFSIWDNNGYCTSSDGTAYTIPTTTNKNFLYTEYAELFYEIATPPTLLTIDKDPVLPSDVTWYYKNRSKEFLAVKNPQTTDQTLTYEMTGVLDLHFDKIPDVCDVSVYEGGKEIFNGSYRELSTITTELGSVIDIKVHAEWNQHLDSDYYGVMEYRFSVRIRNQSNFFMDTDTVRRGSFAVLSCTNVTELSKIRFTPTEENVIPNPVFHRDGEYVRALLVFPDALETEEFSFSVSYGASEQSFSLSVLPSPEAQQFSYEAWTPNDTLLTEEARNGFSDLLASLPQTQSTNLYFRGNFLDPTEYGFTVGYTHGSEVFYGETLTDFFVALGAEFRTDVAGGARVLALNHGIVLLTGENELLGRFIVVDHGGGLRTWYCHMGDHNVNEGNVVKKGDVLGWTGNGGLSTGNGTLILTTVYGAVIDPSGIIGKEILFQAPSV